MKTDELSELVVRMAKLLDLSIGTESSAKESKNIMFAKYREVDQYYKNLNIGVQLKPEVDTYLRYLAAGHSHDAMKVFMAQSLIECLCHIAVGPVTGPIAVIEQLSKEVDLDFTNYKDSEAFKQAKEEREVRTKRANNANEEVSSNTPGPEAGTVTEG